MNRIRIIIIVILVLAFAAGCSKVEHAEMKEKEMADQKRETLPYDNTILSEEGVRNAIRGYARTVIDVNMQGKYLNRMTQYAVDREVYRVISFITERRKKEVVMRSRLSELRFKEISSTLEEATVVTEEKWHYDYVDFAGKMVEPVIEMNYNMKYKLVRLNDKWLVNTLEELTPPQANRISPPVSINDL